MPCIKGCNGCSDLDPTGGLTIPDPEAGMLIAGEAEFQDAFSGEF